MAQLLNQTRWQSPGTATSSFNVTIPATSAGSKLICISGGGAVVTAKLGVGGTTFTKRTTSLGSREVAAQDIVDASGGTTTIQITLNGAENVDGMIFEFASGSLGNFITGNNQSGTGGNSLVDAAGHAIVGQITTASAAVLFTMFTASDTISPVAVRKFWGLYPLGKQFENNFNAPDATKSKYWSMIGVSDQSAALSNVSAVSSRVFSNGEHQSCAWAYQDLSGGTPTYSNPYPNAMATENSLPGDLYSSWSGNSTSSNIAGYTDAMSYAPGDTVNFKVDSLNNAFTVEIYRFGHYNYFAFGARQYKIVTGSPAVQPAPTINAYGGTVCAWSTTASWTIPATMLPGVYVYNMRRTDASGIAQGIFVVRSTVPGSQAAKIMVPTADFTWQAYNAWGSTGDSGTQFSNYTGRNVYSSAPTNPGVSGRAYAVSYDRPFGTVASNNITYFWDSEAALISFLEANAYDVDYYSMVDIEQNTAIPSKYKVAVSSGHSEYWSANMRDAYDNARDAGTNLIFVTSNTSLWHVRFDPADTNKRNMICYKDSLDQTGWDNTTKYDPITYTGTWRDYRTNAGGVNNNARRPESSTTGQWFIGNGTFTDRIAVPDTYRSLPLWRNTAAASTHTISVRGIASAHLTSPGTTVTITTPIGTQVGDLIVIAVAVTGSASIGPNSVMRVVRRVASTTHSMAILVGYATGAGSGPIDVNWSGSINAAATMVVYANAIWEDPDGSVQKDTTGVAQRTTPSVNAVGTTRWAVCAFADYTTSQATASTFWTPGAGLTSRAGADNSAEAVTAWCSVVLLDTNGAVTAGAHQYSATAQFTNTNADTGIFYISPGVSLINNSIGAEFDYLNQLEPSTPVNMVRLSQQSLSLLAQASVFNGQSYGGNSTIKFSMTMYQATSGALVFNSGSWRFTYGLSRWRAAILNVNASVDTIMQQAFLNLLKDFGLSPGAIIDTTANNDPTALVDPGAAQPASAYGFPVNPGTSYQSLLKGIPPDVESNDGIDYTLGTLFTAAKAGKIYGIVWYFPGTLPDPLPTALLYSFTDDTHGSELARTSFTDVQSGWNVAMFNTPVSITANTQYVAAIWTPQPYVSSSAFFQSGPRTSGDLTGPANGTGHANGKFLGSIGSPSYPTQNFNGAAYFIDVLYLADGTPFEGWGFPIN
ncbi:MAG TPA: DUF4082 domain-containing protein [Candidatus Saccharimonadales bacterium]